MDKKLEHVQNMLNSEKKGLLDIEARLSGQDGLGESMKNSLSELSTYDNHPADVATELYERSKDLGLLEVTRNQIAQIDEALVAIQRGNYGLCHNCGKHISEKRLLALPQALLCVQCKRAEEERDRNDRPIEEESMAPAFVRTFLDETDNVGFDGEDAWEAVARYGTSSYIERD